MEQWIFTFGTNHVDKHGDSLANKIVVIPGTFGESRNKMFEYRGPKWSMQYDNNKLQYLVDTFDLQEVKLEDIELLGCVTKCGKSAVDSDKQPLRCLTMEEADKLVSSSEGLLIAKPMHEIKDPIS